MNDEDLLSDWRKIVLIAALEIAMQHDTPTEIALAWWHDQAHAEAERRARRADQSLMPPDSAA